MIFLGVAKLVEKPHETGIEVKYWDLTPWGGPELFMGPVTQTLPPPGFTVDKGDLRIDTHTGKVWKLEGGEAPPAGGPSGRLKTPLNLQTIALVAAGAYLLAFGARMRPRR